MSFRRFVSSIVAFAAAAAVPSTVTAFSSPAVSGVDPNSYNVPFEKAVEEWTAEIHTQSSMMEEGIFLAARDRKNIAPEPVTTVLTRTNQPGGGLGLELEELLGGREDGVGVTTIAGVVEGGNGVGTGILPGDCLVSLQPLGDGENDVGPAIMLECLDFERTVDGILSLPPDWERLRVGVKRLRRRPKVEVRLQFPPEQKEDDQVLELFAGENLRRAMLTRGVKLNDALSARFDSGGRGDCGAEGTCATCVVSVIQGVHLLNEQSIQEEQILRKNPRWRFACRAVVGHGNQEGSVTLKVNPRQW